MKFPDPMWTMISELGKLQVPDGVSAVVIFSDGKTTSVVSNNAPGDTAPRLVDQARAMMPPTPPPTPPPSGAPPKTN